MLFWDNMWSLNVQKPIFAKIQLDMCFSPLLVRFVNTWGGAKTSYRILCNKTICNDCFWYFEMNCEVWMYKNHSFPRYSQICVLPNLVNFINSRGGVKKLSRTLCPKTICNDCLCYAEIICKVWMYKNQYLPSYSEICVLPILVRFVNTRGGAKISSRILCNKTICNDCLWCFEMNCEVWMYNYHSFPRYGQICVLPNLVNFINSRGGGEKAIPNTLP